MESYRALGMLQLNSCFGGWVILKAGGGKVWGRNTEAVGGPTALPNAYKQRTKSLKRATLAFARTSAGFRRPPFFFVCCPFIAAAAVLSALPYRCLF